MSGQPAPCPVCGTTHSEAIGCATLAGPAAADARASTGSGPCNCLPAAQDGWERCHSCGLAQRPGKAFCDFCGHRWQAAEPPTAVALPVVRLDAEARPARR